MLKQFCLAIVTQVLLGILIIHIIIAIQRMIIKILSAVINSIRKGKTRHRGLSCRRSIVLGQQIHTILVHTDTLPLGVLGQGLVQAFGDSQLELAGVAFQIARLPDGDTVLQSSFQPGPLGILGVGYRRFYRSSTGDASSEVRVGHHKAALITIFYNLHAVRQG